VRLQLDGYACLRCGQRVAADAHLTSTGCPACQAAVPANLFPLVPEVEAGQNDDQSGSSAIPGSLWRFADRLPVCAGDAVSFGEGLTPMVHANRIGRQLGLEALFVKDESRNPTWSHKDRFSTVMVSYARLSGAKTVATASSGNAGASLAAYAAAAGLDCIVSTFASTAGAMVAQTKRYGAKVIPFESKPDRWSFLAEGARRFGWLIASPYHAPVVGSHPVGLAGYKTLAYEIVEQIGEPPDWCILPVCYGDALIGLWQGFLDLRREGRIDRIPRLAAAEVYGSLRHALEAGAELPMEQAMEFETVAVSIGTNRSTFQALQALRASGGAAATVGNSELLDMQCQLAQREGLFVELTAAAPLVALQKLLRRGTIRSGDRVVAIATAGGLKDLDRSAGAKTDDAIRPFASVEDALDHLDDVDAYKSGPLVRITSA
jgi:threonine synthase